MRKIALIAMLAGGSMCASANTLFNLNSERRSATAQRPLVPARSGYGAECAGQLKAINVTGSTLSPTANYDYTSSPSDSNYFNISSTEVALAISPFVQDLVLHFTSSLGGGGTINLVTGLVGRPQCARRLWRLCNRARSAW